MEHSRTSKSAESTIIEIDPISPMSDNGRLAVSADSNPSTKESTNPKSSFDGPDNSRGKSWILLAGGIIAILWSAGAIAYVAGMVGVSQLTALPEAQMAGLVFGSLGPALFIIALSWAIREIVLFSGAALRIHTMAERFADPAKFMREDAKAMANSVTTQMANMNTSVEGALARLGAMEEVLQHHSKAFAATEISTRERTDSLINDLRREREAVAELADQLDQKAADIAITISEQSKMVVSAADIANAQTSESSKMLTGATRRLEQTAKNATTEASLVSKELEQASDRMDQTAVQLTTAHQDLQASTSSLNQAQSSISEALNARKGEVRELLDVSAQCADRLQSAASDSAKEISRTLDETLKQARHYTSIIREEGRDSADKHKTRAAELQSAADQAHKALDAYADAITKRLEHANEASFTASSWADKTFEKLQDATSALDKQLQSLPETANASAQEVESTLRKRLENLNEASLNAANKARNMDEAFQSRIRQNYELLSDFMLRMGATAAPSSSAIEVPNPLNLRTKDTQPNLEVPVEAKVDDSNSAPEIIKTAEIPQKITSPEASPIKKEGWHWKDVLSRIDRPAVEPSNEAEQPEVKVKSNPVDRLVVAFRDLEIQPDRLFDATSYRAAALARISNGHRTMADVVRVDAADAISQLHKLFNQDASLKLDAQEFITELRLKVGQAADSGNQLHVETHLRTGDGPAYLLLEAALID